MPELVIVKGSAGYNIHIAIIDQGENNPMVSFTSAGVGNALNFTSKSINSATLIVKGTDYVSIVLTKTLTISSPTLAPQLTWSIISADTASFPAGTALYGQINLSDGSNLVLPTKEFDIRVEQKL